MQKRIVGVLELASKYKYGVSKSGTTLYRFIPYDKTYSALSVGSSERDTSHNQLAIVEITQCNEIMSSPSLPLFSPSLIRLPRGNLVRLLGPVGDYTAEKNALIHHFIGVTKTKTKPKTETDVVSLQLTDEKEKERIELSKETGWIVFHVDPEGCQDIDDAIAWNPTTKQLAIAIADLTETIHPDTDLDKCAYTLGATFYDTKGTVVHPMLPKEISEGSCSLLPGERRKALVLFLPQPSTEQTDWAQCWITVEHSFTYETFTQDVAETLGLKEAASTTGKWDSHEWIAEMMIRYNSAAGQLLKDHGIGLLRTQKQKQILNTLLDSIPSEFRFLITDQKAIYEPTEKTDQSHFRLGLTAYAHASSPLRRYADLLNQRAIVAILNEETPVPVTESISEHLNNRSDMNRKWSRDLLFLDRVTPGRLHTLDVVLLQSESNTSKEWNTTKKTKTQKHLCGFLYGNECYDCDTPLVLI